MHSADFKFFEISYSKILRVLVGSPPYAAQPILTVEIQIYKPHFYLSEPQLVVGQFLREHGLQMNDLYPEIPF